MVKRLNIDDESSRDRPRRANTLNDLTASEWLSESVSVWTQRGLGSNHAEAQIEKLHPAPFSFTDVARLVRLFTKQGMTVLDPFVGVGSTLKACALEGRNGIGFELNPAFAELAVMRLEQEVPATLLSHQTEQTVLQGDARVLADKLDRDSVDFLVTSPPYWGILEKVDHKAIQERVRKGLVTDYGDDPRDLAKVESYVGFVAELGSVFELCRPALRPGAYVAVIVGAFRHKSRFHMLHADLANELERRGFVLKAVNVLYQRHKRVFPYGYPAAYVSNVHHQYIVVLRKD